MAIKNALYLFGFDKNILASGSESFVISVKRKLFKHKNKINLYSYNSFSETFPPERIFNVYSKEKTDVSKNQEYKEVLLKNLLLTVGKSNEPM